MLFFIIMLFCSTAFAEVKTYTATGVYVMSASETLDDGIRHAREDAMRQISESVGVYIESMSEVRNQQLTEDQIKTISTNIINVTGEEPPSMIQRGKGIEIRLTVTATADSNDVFNQKMKDVHKEAHKEILGREFTFASYYDSFMVDVLMKTDSPELIDKAEKCAGNVIKYGKTSSSTTADLYSCRALAALRKNEKEKAFDALDSAIDILVNDNEQSTAAMYAIDAANLAASMKDENMARAYIDKFIRLGRGAGNVFESMCEDEYIAVMYKLKNPGKEFGVLALPGGKEILAGNEYITTAGLDKSYETVDIGEDAT